MPAFSNGKHQFCSGSFPQNIHLTLASENLQCIRRVVFATSAFLEHCDMMHDQCAVHCLLRNVNVQLVCTRLRVY